MQQIGEDEATEFYWTVDGGNGDVLMLSID